MNIRILLSTLCLMLATSLGSFGSPAHASEISRSSNTGVSVATDTPAYQLLAQYYEERPRGGSGTRSRPRDEDVPTPGSGRQIPTSAADAASAGWTGCRAYRNRFKEPFQRCCKISRDEIRSCVDRY